MSTDFQKPSSIAKRTLAMPPRQFEGQSKTLIYFQRVPISCLHLLLTTGLLYLYKRVPIDISGSSCDSVTTREASVVDLRRCGLDRCAVGTDNALEGLFDNRSLAESDAEIEKIDAKLITKGLSPVEGVEALMKIATGEKIAATS